MITVHHLNESRSQRVLWLLEELELPYEIKHYARNAQTRLAPPEFPLFSPERPFRYGVEAVWVNRRALLTLTTN